jgi:hypothetical protein
MEDELMPWTEKYRPSNIENLIGKFISLTSFLFLIVGILLHSKLKFI